MKSIKNKIFKIFPKGKQADINDYSPLIGEKINIKNIFTLKENDNYA